MVDHADPVVAPALPYSEEVLRQAHRELGLVSTISFEAAMGTPVYLLCIKNWIEAKQNKAAARQQERAKPAGLSEPAPAAPKKAHAPQQRTGLDFKQRAANDRDDD